MDISEERFVSPFISQFSYNEDVSSVIANTERFTDTYLRTEAKKALEILEDPGYELQNKPEWVVRLEGLAGSTQVWLKEGYTTSKMLKALYDSAESCGLPPSAQRYVSAAVYASAVRARASSETEPDVRGALANALEQLATTWVAYLLWPFITTSAIRQYEDDISAMDLLPEEDTPSELPSRHKFKSDVTRRENYTCCLTGYLDEDAPKEHLHKLPTEDQAFTITDAAYIFKRAAAVWDEADKTEAKTASRRATYDILRHYCGLEGPLDSVIDSPENGICLELSSHRRFDEFKWCLKPTETEDTYEFCLMPSYHPQARPRPSEGHTHITFTDHSAPSVALPRQDLLRLHAVLAHVLHLSGAMRVLQLAGDDGRGGGPCVGAGPFGADFMERVVRGAAWNGAEPATSRSGVAGAS